MSAVKTKIKKINRKKPRNSQRGRVEGPEYHMRTAGMAMIRAMRNQEIITSPMSDVSYRTLDVCQLVSVGISLERTELALRFAKPSLQGDRIGLQSAFEQPANHPPE